jgi:UDP-glucose 4-epimerase
VVLRPVLVYGPGVKGNMGALMRLARLPLPLPLRTISGRRSLLDAGSLASAVAHTLRSDTANRRVFLVADREPVTVSQIVTALRAGAGRPPGLFKLPHAGLRAAALMVGATAAWQRLNSDLVVDASSLQQTGWMPCQNTGKALAACLDTE